MCIQIETKVGGLGRRRAEGWLFEFNFRTCEFEMCESRSINKQDLTTPVKLSLEHSYAVKYV